jgi:hypothetical protein
LDQWLWGVYANFGLNIHHWLLSIAIGALLLLISLITKTILENKLCISLGSK